MQRSGKAPGNGGRHPFGISAHFARNPVAKGLMELRLAALEAIRQIDDPSDKVHELYRELKGKSKRPPEVEKPETLIPDLSKRCWLGAQASCLLFVPKGRVLERRHPVCRLRACAVPSESRLWILPGAWHLKITAEDHQDRCPS